MLTRLSIRDVVLIDRLDIAFAPGLCVLTGETGAGKSILLDALGLALGVRAESRLVRHGAEQASASAVFEVAPDHAAVGLLTEQGLDAGGGQLILRRLLGRDGRSKAFINDQPVGVGLLRQLGEALVEIHGQFESRRLTDPAAHRDLLDAHGRLGGILETTREAHHAWKLAADARTEAEAAIAKAGRDEDFLRHALGEIEALAPKPGEEAQLAAERNLLLHGAKLLEGLNQAASELAQGRGAEALVQAAARHLEKVAPSAEGRLDGAIAALDRASAELAEAVDAINRASSAVDLDPKRLEKSEERLFALKAMARKHGVEADALADLGRDLASRLAALENGGADLERLRRAEEKSRAAYVQAAATLSQARLRAAEGLDKAMAGELEPLRLGKSHFVTHIERLDESTWGEKGMDRVAFEVATNPGSPPGPLAKIASGGELARFMLALKVVLADADPVPTLIFDEVDAGIGGATASAVGERLARLSENVQVLVVTHSPQVAAAGSRQWRVAKFDRGGGTATRVEPLLGAERREEIARMLAGSEITPEARAAADALLAAGRA